MVSTNGGKNSRLNGSNGINYHSKTSTNGIENRYSLSKRDEPSPYQFSQTQRNEEMQSYLNNKNRDSGIIQYGIIGIRHQDVMGDYEKETPRFLTISPYDNFRSGNTERQTSKPRVIYVGKSEDSFEKLKKKKYSSEYSRKIGYDSERNMPYKPMNSRSGISYN